MDAIRRSQSTVEDFFIAVRKALADRSGYYLSGLPALDLIIDSIIGGGTAIVDQVHSISLYQ